MEVTTKQEALALAVDLIEEAVVRAERETASLPGAFHCKVWLGKALVAIATLRLVIDMEEKCFTATTDT